MILTKFPDKLAKLINADPKEIIFTSGDTESNNVSIKDVDKFYKNKKKYIINTQTEHECILESCRSLQQEGFDVIYLPVKVNGLIDLKQLEEAIRLETFIISIMTVNNELGGMQPIDAIGKLCRSKKIFFHTDAAQAAGKVPLDVNIINIDLMSISDHKLYGPKGGGALCVRRRPRVRLEAVQNGGGQERVSDLALFLILLLLVWARLYDHQKISKLSKRLINGIQFKVEHVYHNSELVYSYPGCVNLPLAYVKGESLIMALKDTSLSSGSACTSASLEPSYVLRVLEADDKMAHSSIRISIG